MGCECLITREPGGTAIGEAVRNIILNPDHEEMSDVTEMLLYAASRAQLMSEVIIPALEAGKIVISDRFVDSSIVYQGIARGLGTDTVAAVNRPGIGQYEPDCIFLLIYLKKKESEERSFRKSWTGWNRKVLISTLWYPEVTEKCCSPEEKK